MGDFFMSGTKEKKLNLPQSLLLLLLIIVSVAVCIRLKTGGPMIGLFASWIFIYLFCKIFGISYANIVARRIRCHPYGRPDALPSDGHRCHDRHLAAEWHHCHHHFLGLKND